MIINIYPPGWIQPYGFRSWHIQPNPTLTYLAERDFEMSRTEDEVTAPMQLVASHMYTETGLSRRACSANMSPEYTHTDKVKVTRSSIFSFMFLVDDFFH